MKRMVGYVGIVVTIVVIISILTLPLSRGWTEGQAWGYKWETDWKNLMQEHSGNISFSGSVYGKTVNAFIVKYMGESNGKYRFNFEGSYYAYGQIKGKVSVKDVIMNRNGDIDMEIKSVWINYDGYFDLVECRSSYFMENYTYYGMKDIKIHYYTKKPLDMYGKMDMNFNTPNGSGEMIYEIKLGGGIDINSEITFNEPIPYLPGNDTPNYVWGDTYALYTGHWKLNTNGYFKMSGTGSTGSSSSSVNSKTSFDRNIDRDFNGNVSVFASLDKEGNYISRVGILENIAPYFNSIFPMGMVPSKDVSFKNYLDIILSMDNQATYDSSEGFYTSIKLGSRESGYMPDINPHGESSQANESEVKNMENNAPSMYGSYREGLLDIMMDYLLYILIGIVVVIIVVVVVLVIRKKR